MNSYGNIIPTLYAGSTLDCALMETVFHDVPYTSGLKAWSKASHVDGKVYSELVVTRNLNLIDLSSVALRKLGIKRGDLIDCDGSHYDNTREWALAFYNQNPSAEGLFWTSRQDDTAQAIVFFEDRIGSPAFATTGSPTPLTLPDGSSIMPVLGLAERLGVYLV
jgi:hypothetical protein